jgi:hypothetical protein
MPDTSEHAPVSVVASGKVAAKQLIAWLAAHELVTGAPASGANRT